MSMGMNWVEGQLRELGDEDLAMEIGRLHAKFRERHPEAVDVHIPVEPRRSIREIGKNSSDIREKDLSKLILDQVSRYNRMGLGDDIGMEWKEYKDSFSQPDGLLKPKDVGKRFVIPLVVDPRINVELIRSRSFPQIEGVYSEYIRELVEVPRSPYLAWFQIAKLSHKSIVEQRDSLKDDEVGMTHIEATAFFVQYPEFFGGNFGALAIGSETTGVSPYIPCLTVNKIDSFSPVGFDGGYSGNEYSGMGWRVLTRSKAIVPLGAEATS